MRKPHIVLALVMLSFVGGAHVFAADDPVLQDLKVTIALQGFACDEIASATRNADSDYTASCRDGNRYHIFVDAQGRVVVQKL